MASEKNIIFGINPVLERFKSSHNEIREVLISHRAERGPVGFIKTEAERLGIAVASVEARILDRLAGSPNHQGVAVRVAPYKYLALADLLKFLTGSSSSGRLLILDGLTDPRNFGALLRTAEAVGISYVVIPKDRSVDVTPIVVKASAGAAHHVKIVKVTNLRQAIVEIKKTGYWIIGLEAHSSQLLYDAVLPAKLALVLGSEGAGIRPLVLRECDYTLAIPMVGKIASLNVAVAGAVFLYEALRQGRYVEKGQPKR